MVVTGRVAAFIGRRILGDHLELGEKVLGNVSEPGKTGDTWIITTSAVWILAKPTRPNRRRGHQRHVRIPRSDVTEVRQVPVEAQTALTVSTLDDDTGVVGKYTGVFRTQDATDLARMIGPMSEVT